MDNPTEKIAFLRDRLRQLQDWRDQVEKEAQREAAHYDLSGYVIRELEEYAPDIVEKYDGLTKKIEQVQEAINRLEAGYETEILDEAGVYEPTPRGTKETEEPKLLTDLSPREEHCFYIGGQIKDGELEPADFVNDRDERSHGELYRYMVNHLDRFKGERYSNGQASPQTAEKAIKEVGLKRDDLEDTLKALADYHDELLEQLDQALEASENQA